MDAFRTTAGLFQTDIRLRPHKQRPTTSSVWGVINRQGTAVRFYTLMSLTRYHRSTYLPCCFVCPVLQTKHCSIFCLQVFAYQNGQCLIVHSRSGKSGARSDILINRFSFGKVLCRSCHTEHSEEASAHDFIRVSLTATCPKAPSFHYDVNF